MATASGAGNDTMKSGVRMLPRPKPETAVMAPPSMAARTTISGESGANMGRHPSSRGRRRAGPSRAGRCGAAGVRLTLPDRERVVGRAADERADADRVRAGRHAVQRAGLGMARGVDVPHE